MSIRNISFNISDKPNTLGKIREILDPYKTIGQLQDFVEQNKDNSDVDIQAAVEYAKDVIAAEKERQKKLDEISNLVRKTAKVKSIINIIFTSVFFLSGCFFIFRFLNFSPDAIKDFKIADLLNAAQFWQFGVHFLYLIIGFVLILFSLYCLKKNTILRDYSGLSYIQNEILSGLGETRPLIQVIKETITNAKKTFTQNLIISKALFWTGLVFIVIALFQILFLGRVAYTDVTIGPSAIAATGVTGGLGILSWIVSTFLSQQKKLQDNLDNVTQLEFALVGFSKQLLLIDLFITGDRNREKPSKDEFDDTMQKISENTRHSLALIELYTKILGEKDMRLLEDEVKKTLDIT